MAEERKKKGHKFHHTRIEHHKDDSHTIHHQHEEGPHKDVKHAVGDIDGLHDSIEENLGTPNEGEAQADAGDHGIPAEHAEPADIPPPAPNGLPLPASGE